MSLDAGGHLTHGWGVSVTGRWFRAVRYGVRRDTGTVDLDEVRELALRERPKLIWCGGTAIPRTIDFAGFAAVAEEVGRRARRRRRPHRRPDRRRRASLAGRPRRRRLDHHAQDAARPARRDAAVRRRARARAVDRAVFPGLQGGPHDHTTAAIAVALHEAAQPEFAAYARAVVANAAALATALTERGFELVSGGTDNHLLLVDLTGQGVGGRPAAEALERAGLVCNYNAVPFDPRPPLDPSGIRLGTPRSPPAAWAPSTCPRWRAGSTRASRRRGARTRRRWSGSAPRCSSSRGRSRRRRERQRRH